MKKYKEILFGIPIGIINVLIGACGGIIAVEILQKCGLTQKQSHATSIAIILPISIISIISYAYNGNINFKESIIFFIPGIISSLIGAKLLPIVPQKTLSVLFSFFIIYAGIRMIIK